MPPPAAPAPPAKTSVPTAEPEKLQATAPDPRLDPEGYLSAHGWRRFPTPEPEPGDPPMPPRWRDPTTPGGKATKIVNGRPVPCDVVSQEVACVVRNHKTGEVIKTIHQTTVHPRGLEYTTEQAVNLQRERSYQQPFLGLG